MLENLRGQVSRVVIQVEIDYAKVEPRVEMPQDRRHVLITFWSGGWMFCCPFRLLM